MPENNIPATVQAELKALSSNLERITVELEPEIKRLKEENKGFSEVAEKVARMAEDNAKSIENARAAMAAAEKSIQERQDEFEALRSGEGSGGRMPLSLGAAFAKAYAASDDSAKSFRASRTSRSYELGYTPRAAKDITNAAGSGADLIETTYQAGVITPGHNMYRIRDLLGGGTTEADAIQYAKESARTDNAGVQATQGTALGESDLDYTPVTATPVTMGHFIEVSVQMLDDIDYLRGVINGELSYMVDLAEDTAILTADGTGGQFDGLNNQATAYTNALKATYGVASPQKLDILRLAIMQVGQSFFPATGMILNPEDWAGIELLKDGDQRYIFASPFQTEQTSRVWGVPVAGAYQQAADDFTVLNGIVGADYWLRKGTTVEISTEDSTAFRSLMASIRAYRRGILCVKRPSVIVKGTFTAALA